MSTRCLPTAFLVTLSASACATVPADAGFEDVSRWTAQRLDERVHWRRGTEADLQADEEVRALLAAPLSPEAAVQIALLENRSIQATYQRLGIAQADLVQAGLLLNPALLGRARFPDGSGSRANVEFGFVQDLLDFVLRSPRKAIAAAQFEETRMAVAAEVIDFAATVRSTYFAALGAEQVATLRRLVVDAAETSADLAQRLHEAGNSSDLELTSELGLYEDTRVAWARADAERLAAREELTRLMGLWGPRTAWTLPSSLPELPAEDGPLADLEATAVATRLDLAAARKESEALARALGVTRDWRFLAMADVGLSAERDPDGQWVTGPELGLELPLFDQGQARIARLVAELAQADQRVIALAVEIRSDVRAARERLIALRRLAQHLAEVVIPLREATVTHTQHEYNYMLVGAFELIAAKQAEYDAYQQYLEAVRDYWMARCALERAVGGDLDRTRNRPLLDPEMPQPHEETRGSRHAH